MAQKKTSLSFWIVVGVILLIAGIVFFMPLSVKKKGDDGLEPKKEMTQERPSPGQDQEKNSVAGKTPENSNRADTGAAVPAETAAKPESAPGKTGPVEEETLTENSAETENAGMPETDVKSESPLAGPAAAVPGTFTLLTFNSRSKAEGFARGVGKKSSVECRVRQSGDAYEVFFPFSDELDRTEKIRLLEAATGMKFPEQ